MIKVECVSCKSPYDVDERRIPASGMKMRCPKCSTSFVVAKDGAVTVATDLQAPQPSAAAKPVASAFGAFGKPAPVPGAAASPLSAASVFGSATKPAGQPAAAPAAAAPAA